MSAWRFLVGSFKHIAVSLWILALQVWWKLRGNRFSFHLGGDTVRSVQGCTAIVTGGNAGIGLETSRLLVEHGMHVIVACRSPERGQEAVEDIRRTCGQDARVETMSLDLNDLCSVRDFVAQVKDKQLPVKVLVNNAGVFCPPFGLTKQGFEQQVGVNHLGHHYLTMLLSDVLVANSPARVVNVSSETYKLATLFERGPEELFATEDTYNAFDEYSVSKLCNVCFTVEFDRRFKEQGVRSTCLHPGVVDTGIFRSLPWPLGTLCGWIAPHLYRTAKEGAATSLYCALSDEVEGVGAEYFDSCIPRGINEEAISKAPALWELSEKLLGQALPAQEVDKREMESEEEEVVVM